MKLEETAKSNQEQAVASWVNYLNQVRLNRLMTALTNQDRNIESAIGSLNDALATIKEEIIGRNRGGFKGMHGFIAEVAECGIGNAREQIKGQLPIYEWINDNGPADLIRNGIQIQQKFVASGNHLSLQAIAHHLEMYPDFLKNGGKYQIPEDHFKQITRLLSISREQANKLPTSTGEFSLKQWKEVHEFFEKSDIRLQDIEPSKLKYSQVQMNKIEETLQEEAQSIRDTDSEIRENEFKASKPSLGQGLKTAAASAALEGGFSFCLALTKKRKSGKKIGSFEHEDWEDVFKETSIGSLKGGVRGISIYALTNYTATPAAVASSLCTATFGIAEQAHLFRKGLISEDEFIMNSEIVCMDASISALSSFLGQAVIPIPILGAVLGNTIGSLLWQNAKEYLSQKEQKLFFEYLEYLHEVDSGLEEKYRKAIEVLKDSLKSFLQIFESTFSPNYEEALNSSVMLAISLGVPSEDLLKTTGEIDDYFLH